MLSKFKTNHKEYDLITDKYICNKFGLAEFLALRFAYESLGEKKRVLDVGCGAGPIGILFADQYGCHVTGVELNTIAYKCCIDNIGKYRLSERFTVFNEDVSKFDVLHNSEQYDMIIANPPIDNGVPKELIEKYADYEYTQLNDESFSYITNSWHSTEGLDLVDYIFICAQKHLTLYGIVVIIFCMIDCDSIDYILKKGYSYGFYQDKIIEGTIRADSIGAESITENTIQTYIVQFSRR